MFCVVSYNFMIPPKLHFKREFSLKNRGSRTGTYVAIPPFLKGVARLWRAGGFPKAPYAPIRASGVRNQGCLKVRTDARKERADGPRKNVRATFRRKFYDGRGHTRVCPLQPQTRRRSRSSGPDDVGHKPTTSWSYTTRTAAHGSSPAV